MSGVDEKKPSARIIYLDGIDTGLKAFTKNQAVASMLRVLHRRGRIGVTKADLEAAYSTSRGRVDFTLTHPTAEASGDE